MFIKICGITNTDDFRVLTEENVQAAGFVAYRKSPRFVTPEKVMEIISSRDSSILKTGVFVDSSFEEIMEYIKAGINVVQLHGDETPELAEKLAASAEVWKAFRPVSADEIEKFHDYPVKRFLIDAFSKTLKGGTGKAADWNIAAMAVKKLKKPVILAGGLSRLNVLEAIEKVKPSGLDISSGVEKSPGIKDHKLIKAFLQKVRGIE